MVRHKKKKNNARNAKSQINNKNNFIIWGPQARCLLGGQREKLD